MTFVRSDTTAHEIGERGHFSLGLVDGDVRVRAVDGGIARVVVRYDVDARSDVDADRIHAAVRLRERRADGMFELDDQPRGDSWTAALGLLVGRAWPSARISVEAEVPREASIHIRVVSAAVHIEGTDGRVALRSVSGDSALEIGGGNVSLDSVSGSVRISAGGPIALRARTVSGDMSASAPEIRTTRLSTVSGDLELEGAFDDQEHRAETASGDLRVAAVGGLVVDVVGIAGDVRSEVAHLLEGSIGHRRVTIGGGGPVLRFRTMSGSLAVVRPRRASGRPTTAPPPAEESAPHASESPVPVAVAVESGPGRGERMAVLSALERGEIDVDEALRQLEGVGDG
jgi:hypothetical protein